MVAYGVDVVVAKKEDAIGGAIKEYLEIFKAQGDMGWAPCQLFGNGLYIGAFYSHTGQEI